MKTLKLIWTVLKEFTIDFWRRAAIIYAVYVAVMSAVFGVWGFIESLTKKGE